MFQLVYIREIIGARKKKALILCLAWGVGREYLPAILVHDLSMFKEYAKIFTLMLHR